MLENVKELLMSVLLRVWDRTYVRNLDSCVRSFVLEALRMWEWAYVHGAYMGFDPHT